MTSEPRYNCLIRRNVRFAIRLSESAGFKQFISGVDRLVWFGLVDRLEPQQCFTLGKKPGRDIC